MSQLLTAVTVVYAALLAVLALMATIQPPKRRAHLATGAVVLEILLIASTAMSVWTQLHGHQPAERAVHLAYLGCSVVLLPVLLVRPGGTEDGRWEDAVLAVAALALAVIAVRALGTWAG